MFRFSGFFAYILYFGYNCENIDGKINAPRNYMKKNKFLAAVLAMSMLILCVPGSPAIGRLESRSAGAYRTSFAVSTPASRDQLITRDSAGPIRLGMTIAEARMAAVGAKFTRSSDGEGIALIDVGSNTENYMTLYAGEEDGDKPIDENARIENIQVWHPSFKTEAGAHPKMKLTDAGRLYGGVAKVTITELEWREFATFRNEPQGIGFRIAAAGDRAGIYRQGEMETTNFTADAYILSIDIYTVADEGNDPDTDRLEIGNIENVEIDVGCYAQRFSEVDKINGKFLFYEGQEPPALFNINGRDMSFELVSRGPYPEVDRIGTRRTDVYQAGAIRIEVEYVTKEIGTEEAAFYVTLTATKGSLRVVERAIGSCGA